MTEKQQLTALAKWAGWTYGGYFHWSDWHSPSGRWFKKLPDYLHSLDAVSELEKKLIFSTRQQYYARLQEVCSYGMEGYVAMSECIKASAAQRCEALLRTIGLWKD